jgi:hypothetical protein
MGVDAQRTGFLATVPLRISSFRLTISYSATLGLSGLMQLAIVA